MKTFDLPSIDTALEVLRLIGEAGHPLRLEAISDLTGLHVEAIRPILDRMANAGFVALLADGRFDIGNVALNLGVSSRQTHQPSNIVSSVLQQLVAECSESATFYIADGDDRVCIDRVEAKTALRNYVMVGTRLPLARGAGGHVLMAFNGAVGEKFDRVRQEFIATSSGQLEADEASMAAPVFGPDDRLFGSILVSGPREHFTPEFTQRLHGLMLKHAADLTVRLGGSASHYPRPDQARPHVLDGTD